MGETELKEILQWVCGISAAAATVWYIWYVGFHLPVVIAKMTPEEREELRKCWEEQEKWER
jgi:hypothetical protein